MTLRYLALGMQARHCFTPRHRSCSARLLVLFCACVVLFVLCLVALLSGLCCVVLRCVVFCCVVLCCAVVVVLCCVVFVCCVLFCCVLSCCVVLLFVCANIAHATFVSPAFSSWRLVCHLGLHCFTCGLFLFWTTGVFKGSRGAHSTPSTKVNKSR